MMKVKPYDLNRIKRKDNELDNFYFFCECIKAKKKRLQLNNVEQNAVTNRIHNLIPFVQVHFSIAQMMNYEQLKR